VTTSRRVEITVPSGSPPRRLDRALAESIPDHSRSFLARLVEERRVEVDGIIVTRTSTLVSEGQKIIVDIPPPAPTALESQAIPLDILYEDDQIAVINKPAGLVVHPAAGHADETLVNALLFHLHDLSGVGGEIRPGIVHRLDKDTSGVMVVAKTDGAHNQLAAAWRTGAVRKEYLAVVYGTPKAASGRIEKPIGRDRGNRKRMAVVAGGRAAVTIYSTLESFRYASLLRCLLESGRTHQIRVHLKSIGHPIIGDPLYSGPQWRGIPDRQLQKVLAGVTRQALHASRITFPHPSTGVAMSFEAPLPDDIRMLIEALRK
jgi:23S rRNA pseudouridine1911/1915/1917 synthase